MLRARRVLRSEATLQRGRALGPGGARGRAADSDHGQQASTGPGWGPEGRSATRRAGRRRTRFNGAGLCGPEGPRSSRHRRRPRSRFNGAGLWGPEGRQPCGINEDYVNTLQRGRALGPGGAMAASVALRAPTKLQRGRALGPGGAPQRLALVGGDRRVASTGPGSGARRGCGGDRPGAGRGRASTGPGSGARRGTGAAGIADAPGLASTGPGSGARRGMLLLLRWRAVPRCFNGAELWGPEGRASRRQGAKRSPCFNGAGLWGPDGRRRSSRPRAR